MTTALMQSLSVPIAAWPHEEGRTNGASQPPAKAVEDAGPWEPHILKLHEFHHLGDNWDGAGAKAPSPELLLSAGALAYVFHNQGTPPPSRVVPGLDGTVLFEWQFPDGGYGEVEVVRPWFAEVMLVEPGQPAEHWTLPT